MSRGRSRLMTGTLACLLASFATAALAHALIAALTALGPANADAYAEHAHGAVGPVALGAAAALVGLLLRVVVSTIARREHRDPFVLLAAEARRLDRLLVAVAVGFGGGATLLGMEFAEQLAAFGRITGAGDALGGSLALGALALGVAALVTSIAGLQLLRCLIVATVVASTLVAAWVAAAGVAARDALSSRWSRRRRRSAALAARRAGRTHRLRAPPSRTRLAPSFALA